MPSPRDGRHPRGDQPSSHTRGNMMDKQQNTLEKTEGRIETVDLIDPFLKRDSISRTPPAMSKESRTENTPIIVNDDTPEGKDSKNIESDDNEDSDNAIRKKTGKQQSLTEFYSLNPTSGGKAERKEDLSEDDDEEWELKTPSSHRKKKKKKRTRRPCHNPRRKSVLKCCLYKD
jgi:hypothetical protein